MDRSWKCVELGLDGIINITGGVVGVLSCGPLKISITCLVIMCWMQIEVVIQQ